MEEEVSESCFCSETLDIILGIGSAVLQHMCTVALHRCFTENMFLYREYECFYHTSNTVALSCLLFQWAPCLALCSSPSSSPSAGAASPPAWRSGCHRTWRGSLADHLSNRHGSTCPLSRTSASGSGYDPGRHYPCFHLEERTCYLVFVSFLLICISIVKVKNNSFHTISVNQTFTHLISWCGWVAVTTSHYETCAVLSRGSGGTVLFLSFLLQSRAFSRWARRTL